eukprot:Sdes_comp19774_c1_seq1m11831
MGYVKPLFYGLLSGTLTYFYYRQKIIDCGKNGESLLNRAGKNFEYASLWQETPQVKPPSSHEPTERQSVWNAVVGHQLRAFQTSWNSLLQEGYVSFIDTSRLRDSVRVPFSEYRQRTYEFLVESTIAISQRASEKLSTKKE